MKYSWEQRFNKQKQDNLDFQCLVHIGVGIILVVVQVWIWWFFDFDLLAGQVAFWTDIARSAVRITATVIIANNFFRMIG